MNRSIAALCLAFCSALASAGPQWECSAGKCERVIAAPGSDAPSRLRALETRLQGLIARNKGLDRRMAEANRRGNSDKARALLSERADLGLKIQEVRKQIRAEQIKQPKP